MPRTERERARGGARGSPEVLGRNKSRPTSTPQSPTAQQPAAAAYTVTLRPEPGVDGIRALRQFLKRSLRSYGLRALDVREDNKIPRALAAAPAACVCNSAVGAKQMAFGKRRGGDFLPVLKFDARVGTFYTQDRVCHNNEWSNEQHDVTEGLTLIIDVKNAQQGWFRYPKGAAPEMVLAAPDATNIGECPGDGYKEGIRVLAKIPGDAAGTRELASTALGFYAGLDELHDKYLAERDEHPGKLPLCELVECREKKLASGSSWEPEFEIIDWVDRPNDMPREPQSPKPKAKAKAIAAHSDLNDDIPY
jgi:hypothetical protein